MVWCNSHDFAVDFSVPTLGFQSTYEVKKDLYRAEKNVLKARSYADMYEDNQILQAQHASKSCGMLL